MPATQKSAKRATRSSAATTPTPPATLAHAQQPPHLEWARNAFQASMAPLHSMLRLMVQMGEAQAELLHDMDHALTATLREAEKASDMQELLRLQSELANEHLGRTSNAASALFRSWLETEAAFIEQAQSQGADVTRKLIQEEPVPAGTAGPGNNGAAQPALTLLHNAQAAWTQMTQEWIDNVRSIAKH